MGNKSEQVLLIIKLIWNFYVLTYYFQLFKIAYFPKLSRGTKRVNKWCIFLKCFITIAHFEYPFSLIFADLFTPTKSPFVSLWAPDACLVSSLGLLWRQLVKDKEDCLLLKWPLLNFQSFEVIVTIWTIFPWTRRHLTTQRRQINCSLLILVLPSNLK